MNREINRNKPLSFKGRSITFVIDGFAMGGAQRNLELILPELTGSRFDIHLIILNKTERQLSLESLRDSGIFIHEIHAESTTDIRKFYTFYKLLLSIRPICIFANLFWSQIWTSIVSSFIPKAKVIWIEHNTYLSRSWLQWRAFKILAPGSKGIYCVSPQVQQFLLTKRVRSAGILDNSVRQVAKGERMPLESPQFIFVGRLVKQKNPLLALESFSFALEQNLIPSTSRLIFIGSGPLFNSIQKATTNFGIFENVQMLGEMSHEEVMICMARSHCLIMTSIHEGFPLARLEGLASGLTVVSTYSLSREELMPSIHSNSHSLGIFGCNSEKTDIAKHLNFAIDPNLWTTSKISSRTLLAENYSPFSVASQYLDLC